MIEFSDLPKDVQERIEAQAVQGVVAKMMESRNWEYLTVEEVAVKLRISTQSVKKLPIAQCDTIGTGKAIRYDKEEVLAYLEQQKIK